MVASGNAPVHVEQLGSAGRTAAERIDLARRIVEIFWPETPRGFADSEVAAAEQRLAITLPAVLRQGLLTVLASRGMNEQDRFFAPGALKRDGAHLVLRIENQGCASWGVLADDADDDPHVWIAALDETWRRDAGRLSSFFVFAALSEAMFAPRHGACGEADPEHLRQLESTFAPLELEPFAFWPGPDCAIRFFGAPDTLLVDASGWLYASCLTEPALQRVTTLITADWEPTAPG